MTISKFSELGLAEPIQRALNAKNYTTPTPIQARAIPELLAGKDVLGIAQTGTGKTAAFSLPILNKIFQYQTDGTPRPKNGPRALVLAPTRELAIQIGEEIRAYGKDIKFNLTVIFGGVGQKPQVDGVRRGVDIIVATPGRLLDLMNQGHVKLGAVEYLVLDEADRMLDMGFVRDVRKIVKDIPQRRQSLLFSATMPKEIASLSKELLNDPIRVEVTPQATPVEKIEQGVYHVNAGDKRSLLAKILKEPAFSRVIVFTRTKHRANRVARHLDEAGIRAEAIHGNKSQSARQRALKQFRDGDVKILVATDIAARGIDVDSVSHVINFELPNEPQSYVHRIGRTARAGANGAAYSFCDRDERAYLRDIEKLIGRKLPVLGEELVAPRNDSVAPMKQHKPADSTDKPKQPGGEFRGKRRRNRNRNRKRAA